MAVGNASCFARVNLESVRAACFGVSPTPPAAGGPSVQLTYGTCPDDGSEFSADGRWIYFNTESFSEIADMRKSLGCSQQAAIQNS